MWLLIVGVSLISGTSSLDQEEGVSVGPEVQPVGKSFSNRLQ